METKFKKPPQRAAILKALEGNKTHPTANEIYRNVKRKFPDISFATVYNNLERLVAYGKLAEATIDPKKKRFDPCTLAHDHVICAGCGRIFDIVQRAKKIKIKGFRVLSFTTQVKALCPFCLKKSRGKERRKNAGKRKR